jgi:hypothetical protein
MDKQRLISELRIGMAEAYRERQKKHLKIHTPMSVIEKGSPDEILGIFTVCQHCGTPRLPENLLTLAIEMANSAEQFLMLRDAFEETLPDGHEEALPSHE